MFKFKREAKPVIDISRKVQVRNTLKPTNLRTHEEVTLVYRLTVDYLTVKLDKEGKDGIREDLKAKMLRKVDEFMDSITLED